MRGEIMKVHKITLDGRTMDWAGLVAETDYILKLRSLNAELLEALRTIAEDTEHRENIERVLIDIAKTATEAIRKAGGGR